MPAPILALLAASSLAAAPVAPSSAEAPDTTTYVVLNHGRPAGEMLVIRDGERVEVKYGHVDRNRGRWITSSYRIAPDGRVIAGETRSFNVDGDPMGPPEQFEIRGDSVRWTGRGTESSAPIRRGAVFRLGNRTAFDEAMLAARLLAQPQQTAPILPAGEARAEVVADTTIRMGGVSRRVRLAMLHGGSGTTPSAVWIDDRGQLVASAIGWFITVHPDAVDALPALRALEMTFRDREGEALARRVEPFASGTILIRNGDLFDAERGVVRPRMSVLIRGDSIVAVGPADSMLAPAGAEVIDATGKTIMPGMWDMHSHFQHTSQTSSGVTQLARGITTVRDLAADIDVAVSHRDRAERGTILGPRAILGGFVEGPGKWAGPSEVIVRTEDEARAWVARYDSLGFEQVKLYNLVHPDLVPTIAEEAEKRGMRLSGHVPRGLSVAAAVALGFDEINHGAFLFSTHFQDSLYVPRMRPYSGVAAIVAPNVDVDSREFTKMIDVLRRNGTVVDGTFNLWMRGDTTGPNADRARRANANYLRLIQRLHEAGVTMVPGTDAFGSSSYLEELQVYERAGIPAPQVLQMATIGSARVMGDEDRFGSIAPGKVADIIVVSGRPAERIADLRNIDVVIRAGRAYRPAQLFEAVGMRMAPRRSAAERTP